MLIALSLSEIRCIGSIAVSPDYGKVRAILSRKKERAFAIFN